MIFGAQNYSEQHNSPLFGASQPISALTAKTSLSGNDTMVIVDNDSTPTTKKITVTNASTSFKTYNDLTYSPKFTTSAGLASLLSDETGSSGGFVRAGSPTLDTVTITTSANITAPTFDVAGTDATGDIFYRNSGGLFTRLPIGSTDNYLRVSGGLPAWTATSTIFPSQTGKANTFLSSDGTNIRWASTTAVADYQVFTSNGTWTKPSGVSTYAVTTVECWGGGGGGGTGSGGNNSGGGGGGAYVKRMFLTSALGTTETVTIAAAVGAGTAGNNSTFGSWLTAYGGGQGQNNSGTNYYGGSGGGALSAGVGSAGSGNGGAPGGGLGGNPGGSVDGYGGGGSGNTAGANGGDSAFGGGGGGGATSGNGGRSVFGGGGGSGGSGTPGTSVFGGAGGQGGASPTAGTAPGGGGGGGNNTTGGNGARGECRVFTQN